MAHIQTHINTNTPMRIIGSLSLHYSCKTSKQNNKQTLPLRKHISNFEQVILSDLKIYLLFFLFPLSLGLCVYAFVYVSMYVFVCACMIYFSSLFSLFFLSFNYCILYNTCDRSQFMAICGHTHHSRYSFCYIVPRLLYEPHTTIIIISLSCYSILFIFLII